MIACIECKKFALRGDAEMAVIGAGRCADKKEGYRFARYRHECKTFDAEDAEKVAARADWLGKQ